jgi:hypothetical protein
MLLRVMLPSAGRRETQAYLEVRDEMRLVRGEDSADVGTGPMDFVDQVRDPRSHHQ